MGVIVVTTFFEQEKNSIDANAKTKIIRFMSTKYNYSKFSIIYKTGVSRYNTNIVNVHHKDNELKFIVTIY